MTNFIKNFRTDESGAVTVDWVVLTAAVVGLAIAVIAAIRPGLNEVAGAIGSNLETGADSVTAIDFSGGTGGTDP